GGADLQRAPVKLSQRSRDCKAKAGTGVVLRELVLDLLERTTELFECILWNAASGVLYAQHDRAGYLSGSHGDLATHASELNGIRQQIDDDLLDGAPVSVKHETFADLRGQHDRFLRCLQRDDAHSLKNERVEVDALALDRELPRLDLRHVENVVDHPQQVEPR